MVSIVTTFFSSYFILILVVILPITSLLIGRGEVWHGLATFPVFTRVPLIPDEVLLSVHHCFRSPVVFTLLHFPKPVCNAHGAILGSRGLKDNWKTGVRKEDSWLTWRKTQRAAGLSRTGQKPPEKASKDSKLKLDWNVHSEMCSTMASNLPYPRPWRWWSMRESCGSWTY